MTTREDIIWHTDYCMNWKFDVVKKIFICYDCEYKIPIKKKEQGEQ